MHLDTVHNNQFFPSPPFDIDADADAHAIRTFASAFASASELLRWKFISLLFISIVSSSIVVDRGELFAEAVESPTVPYKGSSPNLQPDTDEIRNHGNYIDVEVIDGVAENIFESDQISEERLKQEQLPSTNRKQRQKQRQPKQQQQQQPRRSSQNENDAYMKWCQKVLGILSNVEIREFEYVDHLQLHFEESAGDDHEWRGFDWLQNHSEASHSDNNSSGGHRETSELPTALVRGLAAKHDIQVGDIVISVPLYSLLSVPTTIDHDPVLSRILGPDARKKYGWSDTAEYEIALLVIAVLHHRSLGSDSPLSHYLDILLGTPTDLFPFLWSEKELYLKTGGDRGEGVRILARGIRQDLYEMYDRVMGTLVKERQEWFAPPHDSDEWIYSYENFQWAFALVISRHHYLPIEDFDDEDVSGSQKRPSAQSVPPSQMQETLSTVSEVVPPANQPTDSWIDLAKNEERVVKEDLAGMDDDSTFQSLPKKHSFLAPLADLINFGPPCLTGSYNAEEHAFELIATCPFSKGQEVTFWYSSDCADVIVANFGFLHPLVPPCTPPEDWEKKSDEWEEKAKLREKELWEVNRKMDLLKEELVMLESQLVSCECDDERIKGSDSMPAVSDSPAEVHQKLRNGQQSSRQDFGVRGRINDHGQATKEMMEELG